MRRHLNERLLLSACTTPFALEFIFSPNLILQIISWGLLGSHRSSFPGQIFLNYMVPIRQLAVVRSVSVVSNAVYFIRQ
ncbi:unnamed protein product [Peronospora effusa]|nr:unnamed protein product [Peronospora effusa]